MKLSPNMTIYCLITALCLSCGGSTGESEDEDSSGGDDIGAGPEKSDQPRVSKQSSLGVEAMAERIAGDSELSGLWGALQAKGATSLVAAGETRDDSGVEVYWGEAAEAPPSGLVSRCLGGTCEHANYVVVGGKVSLTGAGGGSATLGGIGLPVLLKQLAGHTFDKPTEVVKQALELPTVLPAVDVTKRRAWVVSSFGSLWANGELDVAPLGDLFSESKAFDAVSVLEYVSMSDIDTALTTSHPFDVLVWLGQTVREEVKTNQVFMPVGMTVNAGLFGDRLYDRDRMSDAIALNPLQGTGLVVLASCESIDDGNGGGAREKSMPTILANGARAVVGFVRCGDARDILFATRLFLASYLDGTSGLGASVDLANSWLEAQGTAVRMAAAPGSDLEQRFLRNPDEFWSEYTDAESVGESFLTVYANVVNQCKDSSGKVYQENESFATAWTKNIVWDGPFFSGSRVSAENNVDVQFSGALTKIAPKGRFFFSVKGDLGPKVSGITLYGSAEIQKIVLDDEKPEQFTIEFTGQGVASEYQNEAGDTCIMQPPYLMTTTGGPSTFVIPVPWKAAE